MSENLNAHFEMMGGVKDKIVEDDFSNADVSWVDPSLVQDFHSLILTTIYSHFKNMVFKVKNAFRPMEIRALLLQLVSLQSRSRG